jgi:transketolase
MTTTATTASTPTATHPLTQDSHQLQRTCAELRPLVLEMIYLAQSGHPGTSFSCLELLVALWYGWMRHTPQNPHLEDRDRFVLSKGHGAPALYGVLMGLGYLSREEKTTLRQVHSRLQGHPASRYVDGVDISTGSLGQGLSAAVGMALGLRLNNSPARVFALLGDGECQEGNTWEAFMSGAHHQLTNLVALVDRNRLQIDGCTEDVKAIGDLPAKVRAFGWHVIEIDGHDFTQIFDALRQADTLAKTSTAPTCIVANCVKGKGVSFMENQAGWHGKAPNADQYAQAMAELEATLTRLQG